MDITLGTPEALEKAVAAVGRIVEARRALPDGLQDLGI